MRGGAGARRFPEQGTVRPVLSEQMHRSLIGLRYRGWMPRPPQAR